MKNRFFACVAVCALFVVTALTADAPKPIHVSRAVELLEQGQPIYYTGSHEGPTAASSRASRTRRRGPARIWGISADEYGERADAWPLNPNGELLLGLKLEDKYAPENAEANATVPGVAFAEWGPGDMAFSLGVKNGPGPMPPQLQAARAKVLAATKTSKIFFLNTVNAANVVDMIKEGVMIGAGSQQAAEIGRNYTKRTMPW